MQSARTWWWGGARLQAPGNFQVRGTALLQSASPQPRWPQPCPLVPASSSSLSATISWIRCPCAQTAVPKPSPKQNVPWASWMHRRSGGELRRGDPGPGAQLHSHPGRHRPGLAWLRGAWEAAPPDSHTCVVPTSPALAAPPPAGRRPQEGARLIAQDKRFQLITQTNEREDPAGQRALCPPHFLRTACAFARGRPRRYQPQRAPTARRARALCGHCIPRNPRASSQPPRKQTSSPAFGTDAGPEGFASS